METKKKTRTTRMIYVEEISDEHSSSKISPTAFDHGSQTGGSRKSSRYETPPRTPSDEKNENVSSNQPLIEEYIGNLEVVQDLKMDYQNLMGNFEVGENLQPNGRPNSAIPDTRSADPFLIAKVVTQHRPLTPNVISTFLTENDQQESIEKDFSTSQNESKTELTALGTTESDVLPEPFSTTDTEVIEEPDEAPTNEDNDNTEKMVPYKENETNIKKNQVAPEETDGAPIDIATIAERMTNRTLNRRATGLGSGPLRKTGSKMDLMRNAARGTKLNKAIQNMDEFKTIEDSLMYQTLKPLLTCMKFSGIFFMQKKGNFGKTLTGRLRAMSALQVYCLFTSLVLITNFLRTIPIFDGKEGFDTIMFFKLLALIFAYEAMSRALLNYHGCSLAKRGYQHLFLSLDNVCYPDGIIPYERQLHKVQTVMIIASILISLANVGMTAVGMYVDNEMFDVLLAPVPKDISGIIYFKIFQLGMMFINAYIAMFSLSFFTAICYGLYKEFEYFTRTFCMKIKEDGQFTEDLEKFRIMHQKRCKLVEDADDSFKYYIANTYATNVPLLCLLLYSLVYDESGSISFRFINTFRILYVFLQMMVVSVAATLINSQAHAPLAYIYTIRVSQGNADRQLEMSMFLNKLTGTSIGLTAWDMFVINKPAILTVIGMVLTYFFLIVQVKNPMLGQSDCFCRVDSYKLPGYDHYLYSESTTELTFNTAYDLFNSTDFLFNSSESEI